MNNNNNNPTNNNNINGEKKGRFKITNIPNTIHDNDNDIDKDNNIESNDTNILHIDKNNSNTQLTNQIAHSANHTNEMKEIKSDEIVIDIVRNIKESITPERDKEIQPLNTNLLHENINQISNKLMNASKDLHEIPSKNNNNKDINNNDLIAPQKISIVHDDKPEARVTDDNQTQPKVLPKKGRFTVKAVPKKDDDKLDDKETTNDNNLLNVQSPISNSHTNHTVTSTNTPVLNHNINHNHNHNHNQHHNLAHDTMQTQIEQLLQMNSKILQLLADSPIVSVNHNQTAYKPIPSTNIDSSGPTIVSTVLSPLSNNNLSATPTNGVHHTSNTANNQNNNISTPGPSQTILLSNSTANLNASLSNSVGTTISSGTGSGTSTIVNSNSNTNANNTINIAEREKEKSFHRIFNHLSELKKEVESLQKQKKDWQLESQRIRERCQQLDERLTSETSRCSSLEERLEKSKVAQKSMKILIEQQQAAFDSQAALILSLRSQLDALDPAKIEGYNEAYQLKMEGDIAYNLGDYEKAQILYNKALVKSDFKIADMGIEISLDHQSRIQELYNPIYLHLCKCAMKTAKFLDVLKYIDLIHEQCDYLAIDIWAQIEYIRGCAFIKLGKHDKALECFQKAKEIRINDPAIEKSIFICRKALIKQNENYLSMKSNQSNNSKSLSICNILKFLRAHSAIIVSIILYICLYVYIKDFSQLMY